MKLDLKPVKSLDRKQVSWEPISIGNFEVYFYVPHLEKDECGYYIFNPDTAKFGLVIINNNRYVTPPSDNRFKHFSWCNFFIDEDNFYSSYSKEVYLDWIEEILDDVSRISELEIFT